MSRVRRDKETEETKGQFKESRTGEAFAKRVLDVVEVFGVLDFSAPLHCQGISASSAILQRCSSRTLWHCVPRDDDFALALLAVARGTPI